MQAWYHWFLGCLIEAVRLTNGRAALFPIKIKDVLIPFLLRTGYSFHGNTANLIGWNLRYFPSLFLLELLEQTMSFPPAGRRTRNTTLAGLWSVWVCGVCGCVECVECVGGWVWCMLKSQI